MNRITLHLVCAFLTFTISLSLVWLLNQALETQTEVIEQSVDISTSAIKEEPSRFEPGGRGCGPLGYTQVYKTMPDGLILFEGSRYYTSAREARKGYKKWLAEASEIVERVSNYKNRYGEKGERAVGIFPAKRTIPDKFGTRWGRTLWYGGGNYFLFIEAPTLEIVLDFEKSNAYAY